MKERKTGERWWRNITITDEEEIKTNEKLFTDREQKLYRLVCIYKYLIKQWIQLWILTELICAYWTLWANARCSFAWSFISCHLRRRLIHAYKSNFNIVLCVYSTERKSRSIFNDLGIWHSSSLYLFVDVCLCIWFDLYFFISRVKS